MTPTAIRPSHPEWDRTKMIYIEWPNGDLIGKVETTPREAFDALKHAGASVVSTRDHNKSQCVMKFYQ